MLLCSVPIKCQVACLRMTPTSRAFPPQSLLREPSSELLATKELVSIAQRARKLMTQQSQIDVEVTERCVFCGWMGGCVLWVCETQACCVLMLMINNAPHAGWRRQRIPRVVGRGWAIM